MSLMNKCRALFVSGVLVVLVVVSGFPSSWKKGMLMVLGISIAAFAAMLMRSLRIDY